MYNSTRKKIFYDIDVIGHGTENCESRGEKGPCRHCIMRSARSWHMVVMCDRVAIMAIQDREKP